MPNKPITLPPKEALDFKGAIGHLEKTLEYYLSAQGTFRIELPLSLVNLMGENDRLDVENKFKEHGIMGCEALYLPFIEQLSIEGNILAFPIITTDKKGNRLGDKQIETVVTLLKGRWRDKISLPIFFYPTGAVMAISIQPIGLAKMAYAYALSYEVNT
jgi:hypothetical protein